MKYSRIALSSLLLGGLVVFAVVLLAFMLLALAPAAEAQQVSRVQDIGTLRLGQRVKVDDGTCPAGQIKEVLGAKMGPTGVLATQKCVQRLGPKAKASLTR